MKPLYFPPAPNGANKTTAAFTLLLGLLLFREFGNAAGPAVT